MAVGDYATELSNLTIVGNAISALMSPAFVKVSIGLNLVHTEDFPDYTNVIKFRKSGSLVAETLAQSTEYTFSASSEITDSSVTCTAEKAVVGSRISVEAQRFGAGQAGFERFGDEHGAALGRLFDSSLFTLFSSVSGAVTATSTLTKDNLLEAAYSVRSSMQGAHGGVKLAGVFDYKGVNEVRKELTSISASAFSNPSMLTLMSVPQVNGLAGEFAGIEIYEVAGLPTSGGDDVACVFHPQLCFAAGLGGEMKTSVTWKDASGGFLFEISSYWFYKIVEWNDTAGVRVLSDT